MAKRNTKTNISTVPHGGVSEYIGTTGSECSATGASAGKSTRPSAPVTGASCGRFPSRWRSRPCLCVARRQVGPAWPEYVRGGRLGLLLHYVPILVLASILIWAWYPTLVEMWVRAYPAWSKQSLSLSDRLFAGDAYFAHAAAVPLVSAVLAVLMWGTWRNTQQRTWTGTIVAAIALAGTLLVAVCGAWLDITFISGIMMVAGIACVIALVGGGAALRHWWVPVALLLFMVPMPSYAIARVSFYLQQFAAGAAADAVEYISGISALLDGNGIILSYGRDGQTTIRLVVGQVCSGLRSLIALVWTAAVFAAACRTTLWGRAVILLAAIPIALAANLLRIIVLILIAAVWGIEHASADAAAHSLTGICTFAAALAMLFALEYLCIRIAGERDSIWCTPSSIETSTDADNCNKVRSYVSADVANIHSILRGIVQPKYVGAACAVLMLCAFARIDRHARSVDERTDLDRIAVAAMPESLATGSQAWSVLPVSVSPAVAASDDGVAAKARRFVSTDGSWVEVYIMAVDLTGPRLHSPDVCLVGLGHRMLTRRTVRLHDNASYIHAVLNDGSTDTLYNYTYYCGGLVTESYAGAQLHALYQKLQGRSKPVFLIRVSTPCRKADGWPDDHSVPLCRGILQTICERLDFAHATALCRNNSKESA